jgi:hypothetical protein
MLDDELFLATILFLGVEFALDGLRKFDRVDPLFAGDVLLLLLGTLLLASFMFVKANEPLLALGEEFAVSLFRKLVFISIR